MRIYASPNFVLEGYAGREYIDIDKKTVTLRDLLDELVSISGGKVTFLSPDGTISDWDFDIFVNGDPLWGSLEDLDMELRDGDYVKIIIKALGGG